MAAAAPPRLAHRELRAAMVERLLGRRGPRRLPPSPHGAARRGELVTPPNDALVDDGADSWGRRCGQIAV
ncbi:hypothetical protein HBB16_10180 [Pseudonocardia sp. MCCB 268]|nr:hypothetical protein [Pseudonocardia cytotoxica]